MAQIATIVCNVMNEHNGDFHTQIKPLIEGAGANLVSEEDFETSITYNYDASDVVKSMDELETDVWMTGVDSKTDISYSEIEDDEDEEIVFTIDL